MAPGSSARGGGGRAVAGVMATLYRLPFLTSLLGWFNRFLQLLIPARRGQVVWYSRPDYQDNAHHLFRHALLTRPGLQHVWLVRDLQVAGQIRSDLDRWAEEVGAAEVRVLRWLSLGGYWAYLRAQTTFHTHPLYPWVRSASGGRHCVSLWHGMMIKAVSALDDRRDHNQTFGSLHVATSKQYQPLVAAAFEAPMEQVEVAQYPRNDALIRPSVLAASPTTIRDALGLGDRQFVLWLPTYREYSPWFEDPSSAGHSFLDDLEAGQIEALVERARQANCPVVIKLHPHDSLNAAVRTRGLDDGEWLRVITAPEWRELGLQLYDVLAVAAGLITDVSSVLVDWLVTDKPGGVIAFDPQTYTSNLVVELDRFTSSARVHDLDDPNSLADFFDRAATGKAAEPDGELVDWLHEPGLASGSEQILSRVGL